MSAQKAKTTIRMPADPALHPTHVVAIRPDVDGAMVKQGDYVLSVETPGGTRNVVAPAHGRVEIHVSLMQQVEANALLFSIIKADETAAPQQKPQAPEIHAAATTTQAAAPQGSAPASENHVTQDEPTPHVAAPPAGEPAAEPSADKAAKRTWLQILFFFACIVLAVVWPGLFFLTTGDATLNLNSAGIAASFAAALVIPVWLLGQIPALGGRRAARGFTALAILIVFALALGAGMIWPQMRSVQQSAMASAFGPLVAQISSDTKSMAAKGPSTQKAQKPPVAQTQQKWQPDMIVSLDPRGSALIKAKNPAARAKKIIIDGKEPRNDYDFAVLLAQKRIRLSGSKKANALDYWNLSGVDRKLLEHKHSGAWCTASMKAKLPLTQVTAGDINPFIDDHDRNRTQFATCSFVGLVSGQNGQQAVLLFDVQAKYKRDFEKMEVNAIQKYVNDLIKDRRISNAVKYRDVKFDGLGTHKFTGKSKFTGKPDAEFYPVVVSLSGTNFKSGRTERYLEVIGIVDGWEVQTWIYFPEFARSVVEKEVTTAWLNMAEGIKYRTAFNKR